MTEHGTKTARNRANLLSKREVGNERTRTEVLATPLSENREESMRCKARSIRSDRRSDAAVDLRAALRDTFERNAGELRWLAEVIIGNASDAQECIADAMLHADAASYVAPPWIDVWVKRAVARTAVNRIGAEIRGIAANYIPEGSVEMDSSLPADVNYSTLQSIPIDEVWNKANALERAALVLYLHLKFSATDCALLIGCVRSLIAPACITAVRKILDAGPAAKEEDSDCAGKSSGMAA